MRNKIIKLHDTYIKLGKLKNLNWDTCPSKFESIQEDFIESCDQLFDISVKYIEATIMGDRMHSKEAKQEDLEFFNDQKQERKMYISQETDADYEKSMELKKQRTDRMEKIKAKYIERKLENSNVNSEVESEIRQDLSDEIEFLSSESSEEEYDRIRSSNTKQRIMLNLSTEDLIDCTHEVFTRYKVSVRAQTHLIASITNKARVDLDKTKLSRSTIHRRRYNKIQDLGGRIQQEVRDTLKGKRLIVHFDGKQVKQIEENLNITVLTERISISVTSPDLDLNDDDLLLGIIQTESSKGVDQAEGILAMLEYYEIVDQIIGVCCDTTGSNTGEYSGAVVYLAELIDRPLLWILCRRHILEVHMSYFMEALTGEKTKGPRRGLNVRLQKAWPEFKLEVDKLENITKYNWKLLTVGSPLHELACDALKFGKRALALNMFEKRTDYKKLCQLMVFYLGGNVDSFSFHQPGACHEARFMADSLYILTLAMTDSIVNIMNMEEREMISKAAFFVSICYGPWFLKSYLASKATANDLQSLKSSYHIADQYPNLGNALLKSMQRHGWYLTEQLVVLALSDDDVETGTKISMVDKLLTFDVPNTFSKLKPRLPQLERSTKLVDLIGPESWMIFSLLNITKEEVESWTEDMNKESFQQFSEFTKKLTVVNDCSERNIRLIQDFIDSHKSEDMKQNALHVVRTNRKKVDKEMPKTQLKDA